MLSTKIQKLRPEQLLALNIEARRWLARTKLFTYFPDTGQLRRELYPRHMAFFALGGKHQPMQGMCPPSCDGSPHRERLALCANRVGKTEGMGGYESTLHLTGRYPEWWPGYRFTTPIQAWAAGETRQTVRDIQQHKLMGPFNDFGTGLIPGDDIVDTRSAPGIPNACEQAVIAHYDHSGQRDGDSVLGFKSYDQGVEAFQGTERHVIWADEEIPDAIRTECVTRTMATGGFAGGLLMLTFTPLRGRTAVVEDFLSEVHAEKSA